MSKRKFQETIGVSNSYIQNISNNIGIDVLKSIEEKYPELNTKWLINGEGDMLNRIDDKSDLVEYKIKPFILDEKGTCGTPDGFNVAIKEYDCEQVPLPIKEWFDFSIRAKGSSMINHEDPAKSIHPGDLIACRLWKSETYIRWGEVYALATSSGIVIKKIMPSHKEGMVKCVSYNKEEFPPYDMPTNEIYDWAIVVAVISVNNLN